MSRYISYEEVLNLPRVWDLDVSKSNILKEAESNSNCKLYLSTETSPPSIRILYTDSNIEYRKDDEFGYFICVYDNRISAYIAENRDGTIISGSTIGDYDSDIDLNTLIGKIKIDLNKCPVCRNEILYKDQLRYSFTGRCCSNCIDNMKKEHEYSGWYN